LHLVFRRWCGQSNFPLLAAVPEHSTSIPDVAAATTIVVAGTSASSAVEAAIGVLLQPVDQIMLLPGLRQFKSRAELLQLRDGLHARTNTSDETQVGHGHIQ
jgi:hypothetical protein